MSKWPNLLPEDYFAYSKVCRDAVIDDAVFSEFKRNESYTEILEHTNYDQGCKYLDLIDRYFKDVNIPFDTLFKNDDYGNPHKETFYIRDIPRTISPSNLRYLYIGLDILNTLQQQDILEANIVEIGGGYGGQCLYLHKLAPLFNININKYLIFDLPDTVKLIQKYLANFDGIKFKCLTVDNINDIQDINFVFSNYAYSEFDPSIRKKYFDTILKESNLIYMLWNTDNEIDSFLQETFLITAAEEEPKTSDQNKKLIFTRK